MAVSTTSFTTGPSTLPDTGVLSYNGCVFSPLFETKVSGDPVKDNAQRTVKYMDYTITVDGYVTLPAGASSISPTMVNLVKLLTAQGGHLVYKGRGLDLIVNPQVDGGFGDATRDVAWGPVPELIEFQPLGGGKSAKIQWKVKVRVTYYPNTTTIRTDLRGRITSGSLLQFNYETVVGYGDDGFSRLSITGSMEIPLTRIPTQATRTLRYTVDSYRVLIERQIMEGIDLDRFRVVQREFRVSRDKRSMEWEFTAEERPYMDIPPDCTVARGTYSVRPSKVGPGLCNWLCTLRATYTVRADRPRRVAWFAFLALLRLRMSQSKLAETPNLQDGNQNPTLRAARAGLDYAFSPTIPNATRFWSETMRSQNRIVSESRKAWLIDFSFDEGLYLDSKTITFSATWKLVTTFSHILLASGLWKKLPESDPKGNIWAISMRDVSGSQSWLPNRLDPRLDVIVDFGGP